MSVTQFSSLCNPPGQVCQWSKLNENILQRARQVQEKENGETTELITNVYRTFANTVQSFWAFWAFQCVFCFFFLSSKPPGTGGGTRHPVADAAKKTRLLFMAFLAALPSGCNSFAGWSSCWSQQFQNPTWCLTQYLCSWLQLWQVWHQHQVGQTYKEGIVNSKPAEVTLAHPSHIKVWDGTQN